MSRSFRTEAFILTREDVLLQHPHFGVGSLEDLLGTGSDVTSVLHSSRKFSCCRRRGSGAVIFGQGVSTGWLAHPNRESVARRSSPTRIFISSQRLISENFRTGFHLSIVNDGCGNHCGVGRANFFAAALTDAMHSKQDERYCCEDRRKFKIQLRWIGEH